MHNYVHMHQPWVPNVTKPKPRDSPLGCLHTVQSVMTPKLLKASFRSGVRERKLRSATWSEKEPLSSALSVLQHPTLPPRHRHASLLCPGDGRHEETWPNTHTHDGACPALPRPHAPPAPRRGAAPDPAACSCEGCWSARTCAQRRHAPFWTPSRVPHVLTCRGLACPHLLHRRRPRPASRHGQATSHGRRRQDLPRVSRSPPSQPSTYSLGSRSSPCFSRRRLRI